MQQTRINPLIHQELLESAANGAAKGQAQYYTPVEWAVILGLPLPRHRSHVVDLTAGNGQLMAGITRGRHLGCDIDPVVRKSGVQAVTGDITRFHSLLSEVQFKADLFALNPPWDLHWHRDRLSGLAASPIRAVADAFAAHDVRTGRDTIDSTIASICLALQFCSLYGEGLVIANEATLQRLIFGPQAPHRALLNHIWAHLTIAGNICQSNDGPTDFRTGIIYF